MNNTINNTSEENPKDRSERLLKKWQALQQERPNLRIRDASEELNVSELELLSLDNSGAEVISLQPDWPNLIADLEHLGPLMALSRNNFAVHEKTGIYKGLRGNEQMGLMIEEDIDLRLIFARWKYGYAVKSNSAPDSLQFFAADGSAIHKIYSREGTDQTAWKNLVLKYSKATDGPAQITTPKDIEQQAALLESSERAAFLSRWAELTDVHQFFKLLKDFNLTRIQAMELAQGTWSFSVDVSKVPDFINGLAGTGLPIMVFVANQGIVQIHTGPIERCMQMEHWFNILDPKFSLHLNTAGLERAWIVRKPTSDGVVSSLEVYDIDGELVMQLFGARQEGNQERSQWRDQLRTLQPELPAIVETETA